MPARFSTATTRSGRPTAYAASRQSLPARAVTAFFRFILRRRKPRQILLRCCDDFLDYFAMRDIHYYRRRKTCRHYFFISYAAADARIPAAQSAQGISQQGSRPRRGSFGVCRSLGSLPSARVSLMPRAAPRYFFAAAARIKDAPTISSPGIAIIDDGLMPRRAFTIARRRQRLISARWPLLRLRWHTATLTRALPQWTPPVARVTAQLQMAPERCKMPAIQADITSGTL